MSLFLSVCLLSVCFCLHTFLCLTLVCITHTHTYSQYLITHPPIHAHFHWHNMKWPSDHTNNTPSISPVFHLLPTRPLLSVHLPVKNRRRDTERQMIALKWKTTQFHNFLSALSLRLRQFNQRLWTREMRYKDFDAWYLVDWLVDLLHLKLIDYLTSWLIDWLIKGMIAWLAWHLTDKRVGTKTELKLQQLVD